MIDDAVRLLPFLAVDIVNPVLFAFMVYAAGSNRPILASSMLLLGHMLAYFLFGIVAALGFEQVAAYLANPSLLDYLLGLVIGVLLLWMAVRITVQAPSGKKISEQPLGLLSALGMGAVINFVGIPFALPYFAVVDQILKADLSTAAAVGLIAGYNITYALPFLIVPVLVAILGEKSAALLQRINAALDRISNFLMPVLLGLAGLALIADALLYLFSGEGLF